MRNGKITTISLFSGCGGLDLGFEWAGFNTIWAADKDLNACRTYKYNLGKSIYCVDLRNVEPSSIPDADALICGPPCQGFSNVGKRSPTDDRNSLYLDVLRIANAKKPKVIVVENVKGFSSFQEGAILKELINTLMGFGYIVEWKVLNAKDFNVPQNRERLFIIANKLGKHDFFDRLEQYRISAPPVLKDTIGDLEELLTLSQHHCNGNNNSKYTSILSSISQGQKLCDSRLGGRSVHTWHIPEVFGRTSEFERKVLLAIAKNRRRKRYRKKESWNDASPLTINEIASIAGDGFNKITLNKLIEKGYLVEKLPGLFDLKHTFNGKYRRLDYGRPSEAILTNFGSTRNYIHPTKNRALTPRECARIQGFPDNFFFQGSLNNQYKQIGNAVPVRLARIIAREIKLLINNKFSKNNTIRRKLFTPHAVKKIIRHLKIYGTPRLGNLHNPLDELIYIYLSQRTFEQSYQNIYKCLRKEYPSFEKLRKANKKKMIQILEPAGLATQKAEAILGSLNKIRKDFGETSLRKISKFSEDEKLSYLQSLPRVGIKSAYCILMYSFGSELLPIDANIKRVCQRLGWLPINISDKKEHSILHSIIPPKERYAFHVNCITHGRDVCIPKRPRCSTCFLNDLCPKLGDVKC